MKYIDFEYNINKNFEIDNWSYRAIRAYTDLHVNHKGKMNGWLEIEKLIKRAEIDTIKKYAEKVKKEAEVLLVIGIGGSYLGAKAGIDFLSDYYNFDKNIEIIFVGNSLSEKYLIDTIRYIENKNIYINVISKSGGTMEPAIAFRIFKKLLEKKYGDAAKERIIVTTTKGKGLLYKIAKKNDYKMLFILENNN